MRRITVVAAAILTFVMVVFSMQSTKSGVEQKTLSREEMASLQKATLAAG